ncbi:MAG: glycosyltransferase family 2 protein [Nitrospira sp.]|jgi:glycosyltransferase involved in cell wall biosynthesis|nr:glycosyltransferase family 2 protein [Nitrospira sp.]
MRVPGLVTIMVPVLNGELFLPLALDSLLAQDYPKFEIVILDNQSTDRTAEICREYERRDARVKYVLDTVNRISHDAANHLATFMTGEFCMIACDDDLWAPNFLSVLVTYLQRHPDVGLVFPNACYVDVEGNRGAQRLLARRHLYTKDDSPFLNVWRYLGQRRVVPTIFGVYRSEAYLAALPFDTFDETIADVDNLFLIKLMVQSKVHTIDEILFFYRNKYRGYDPSLASGSPKGQSVFLAWWFFTQHQWRFVHKIVRVVNESRLNGTVKYALRVRTYYTFLIAITVLRVRALVGRLLVLLRLREGPPVKKDIHFEKRSTALRAAGYDPVGSNVSGKDLSRHEQ